MTAQPLQSDLTRRLTEATTNYEARWKPVDSELYNLCGRRPGHRDFADVYTKVAMIGRVYEAGVAQAMARRRRPGDGDHPRRDRGGRSHREGLAAVERPCVRPAGGHRDRWISGDRHKPWYTPIFRQDHEDSPPVIERVSGRRPEAGHRRVVTLEALHASVSLHHGDPRRASGRTRRRRTSPADACRPHRRGDGRRERQSIARVRVR